MSRTGTDFAAAGAAGAGSSWLSKAITAITAHFEFRSAKGSLHIIEGRRKLGEKGVAVHLALHDGEIALLAPRQQLPVNVRAADHPDLPWRIHHRVESSEVVHRFHSRD